MAVQSVVVRTKEPVDPMVLEKIRELYKEGVQDEPSIRKAINSFVTDELLAGKVKPPAIFRRYNPTYKDISNEIAKVKLSYYHKNYLYFFYLICSHFSSFRFLFADVPCCKHNSPYNALLWRNRSLLLIMTDLYYNQHSVSVPLWNFHAFSLLTKCDHWWMIRAWHSIRNIPNNSVYSVHWVTLLFVGVLQESLELV